MAIDYNAGINSIDVGAHDITYSGNQGPKSPDQEREMAFDDTPRFELKPLELLLEEFREDNNGQDPTSIDFITAVVALGTVYNVVALLLVKSAFLFTNVLAIMP